tara:strand:- start:7358 stop:7549 length:192 start_codon:yes stop_codon:yes gene_type:complete
MKIKTITSLLWANDGSEDYHDKKVNRFIGSLNPHAIENINTTTTGAGTSHNIRFLITTTITYR